jgi:hypothetical protein
MRKKRNDFAELSDHELCVCGSNRRYRNCREEKDFQFGYTNGTLAKQIPLSSGNLTTLIQEAKRLFKEIYGRDALDGDFLVPFAGSSTEDMSVSMVYMTREAGIPENLIYASYKSGWLMPTESNMDLLSERDLDKFQQLNNQYNDAIANPKSDKGINMLSFLNFANDTLKSIYCDSIRKLEMTLNDYVRRHSHGVSLYNYEVKTVNDYCIFLSLKTLKIISGINKLYENHLNDSIYILSRGLFESYMYINAINQSPDFFNSKIIPRVDEVNFTFDKHKDGSTNYRYVIHKNSGDKKNIDVKVFDLGKYFTNEYDKELYRMFYQPACKYVHTDILSAQSYFNSFDPYEEIDITLVAGIISAAIIVILAEQIGLSFGTQRQYKKDVSYLLKQIRDDLITCFQILESDPAHPNAVYKTFVKRLEFCRHSRRTTLKS